MVHALIAAALLVLGPLGDRHYDAYALLKELAMHLVAAAGAVYLYRRARPFRIGPVELHLGIALICSAASAALAINRWMTLRSPGLSLSAVLARPQAPPAAAGAGASPGAGTRGGAGRS